MLYESKVSQPSLDPAEPQPKYGYISTPIPIPRFDEKENCTFTVRVPQLFLDREHREEICERRALWGAEIYTDDSDPIAVAIHSGWIRGEWDDEVDISMLDLGKPDDAAKEKIREMNRSKEPTIEMTEPLAVPMLPIKDRDLHITLLIMPRLESYASIVSNGLKSRSWKTRHDGMSFKIEKIAWIARVSGKCEERSGEARRKRMRARMGYDIDRDIGPAIKTNFFGVNGSSTVQPTAMAA